MKRLLVGIGRKIIAVFFLLATLVVPVGVAAQSDSGSVGLEGRVAGSAPTTAPVILEPITDARFSDSPVIVSGTCESDLLIKIFINEVFSGSTMCEEEKFSIMIDLLAGENEIVARAFDDLDQASPDSNSVTVFLDIITSDLKLSSEFARRSANPQDELTWLIIISGGLKPYAIHIDWGDGRDSLKSVLIPGEFSIEHTYRYSGIYKVVVRAVDAEKNRAILQLVAVAKGTTFAPSPEVTTGETKTVVMWIPMVIFILFMISTFWLGVRYERKRTE